MEAIVTPAQDILLSFSTLCIIARDTWDPSLSSTFGAMLGYHALNTSKPTFTLLLLIS